MNILIKARTLIERKEQAKFGLLLILMIIASLFEMMGMGLIVPFIGLVTNPEMIIENKILNSMFQILSLSSANSFIIMFAFILVITYILKNIFLLFFYSFQYKLIYQNRVNLSERLFKEYLKKPYAYQLQTNSSEMVTNVNHEVSRLFNGVLIPLLFLISEIIIALGIVSLLLFVSPLPTISLALLLTISIGIFLTIFKNKLEQAGRYEQDSISQMTKWINQGLGAIKIVKVNGKESFFLEQFKKHSEVFVEALRYIQVLNQVPRLFIETIIVTAILFVMVMLLVINGKDLSVLLTTMALFSMSTFRLMPSSTKIVSSLSSIRYNYSALEIIYNDLMSMEKVSDEFASFKQSEGLPEKYFSNEIKVDRLYFTYTEANEPCIKGISMTIPIGQSVALVGKSGSGKTTLVDLMLGLHLPDSGSIFVDGKNLADILPIWKNKVGYIPQSIYLSDDSILRNVAFGIDDRLIDVEQVWKALEAAQLKEFVEKLPNQLETSVGEQGVRLSGGQRQRIGIARALYHNPEIIFLDEATSALDNDTEKEIMKAIDSLKGEKTLIIIAHRLTTIEKCDHIFEIEDGQVKVVKDENKNFY
ncbi:ABC transporter ATP-binding protein [Schinkia azotoformans]|uniref:ABC transporter ATP-binding protein n=2 Tax=Schinkia azotoformans TaxID=1454 RepID=UPI002DBC349D|nr:ABC transporter ATP-binding protein [Schinkia azotoformans]MEC1716363.1 ABC transporter ATP-binding protein [Schinkia azotoformans]MEC1740014.1 ABC transporter ATP-binding protein [Schinkia azotoformans]MEC1746339.1 ABC transporter ATP-binding protein [Schinkia azotoformans]MEC1759751.1 ABC transporter ATP-binding protein [Schinkia azotoformans]MEC1766542.1 ABC transporter ATP-binding protein [Schinkia azotoformans]